MISDCLSIHKGDLPFVISFKNDFRQRISKLAIFLFTLFSAILSTFLRSVMSAYKASVPMQLPVSS